MPWIHAYAHRACKCACHTSDCKYTSCGPPELEYDKREIDTTLVLGMTEQNQIWIGTTNQHQGSFIDFTPSKGYLKQGVKPR